ncbi:MAG: pentapeptide repeat-containing protein [Rhodospirillales bacterium]
MPDSAAEALERHRAWLEAGCSGERPSLAGEQLRDADLRGARLTGADLRGASFAGADLTGADLEGADLEGANLRGASLAGANLRRCRLAGSHLRDIRGLNSATLRDADLQGATGLTGTEFAGADLVGTQLPQTLSFQPRLDYVAQTSQNARPAFLSIMLSCVFIILTVFSTPDSALLANASLAVLPDLATNIPAASFFWVAPVLLLGLYVYMHLQMHGIGETLADLPAVFPDGTPLEKRAYPWIATNLLRMRRGWSGLRFEEVVTIFLLWGTVPLTLLAIWLRYLPLRDWPVSGMHVILIVACGWGAIRLFEQTAARCAGGAVSLPHGRAVLTGFAVLLSVVTVAAGSYPLWFNINPRKAPLGVLDLRDADLSHAILRKRDLRYAAGGEAKLSGADLRDARLDHSDFQRSAFTGADMESASLAETDLDSADFRGACLRKASLHDADMEDATFRHAYLGRADLRSRLLTRADFSSAELHGADLRGADLTGADFRNASLRCFASHKTEPSMQIDCASLEAAELTGARFEGADLAYAVGLTQAQLDGACGDAATRLPQGLVIRSCPPRQGGGEPASAEEAVTNPCAHELRDDRWPQ